jgi:aldehyde dehydrogenase (NAD+)
MINSKEKPLALYIFSTKDSNIDKIINNTSAGGTTINDTLLHVNHPNLPFGGVNNSGIGSGHGIFSFKAFSHERAVMKQPALFSAAENMYPPYNGLVRRMIDFTLKYL